MKFSSFQLHKQHVTVLYIPFSSGFKKFQPYGMAQSLYIIILINNKITDPVCLVNTAVIDEKAVLLLLTLSKALINQPFLHI